ncbi:LacI family DNA-binding transcriptional regulator [Streptomyces sp. NPDC055025]
MAGASRSGGRNDRPATLALVAQRAAVSPQTVSNALNSPDLLAPRTLERVRRAIDELDYRPHPAARLLRSRHSRLIGLGIRSTPSGLSGPSAESFLHGLSDSAGQAGYRVLLFPVPADPANDPERYAELIRERSVDAFVLTDTYRGDRRSALLSRHGVPFVVSGRSWPSRGAGDWVDVDGARGTATAVDHLVASGHRRIAFLGWPRGSGAGDDRALGWREAVRRHGLPSRGLRGSAADDVDAARQAAGQLLAAGASAVVAASDTLALGCYRALRDSGRVPGKDVAVVGFDDSTAAGLVSPGLSSLRRPAEDMGRECARLLLARIKDPRAAPEHVLLAPELIVRESSVPDGILLAGI